jgi:hypothetical protein
MLNRKIAQFENIKLLPFSKRLSPKTQNIKVLTDLDTSLTNVDGNTLSHVVVFFLGNKPFSE